MGLKVCYITTLSVTLKTFVQKSAEYNIEQGNWDVSFICDDTPNFQKELPENIRYIPIKMKRGVSLSGIISIISLYQIFRKEKFDLVQYSTSNAGFYASIASRLAKIPVRLYCQWGLDYIHFSGIKRILMEIIERTICHLSTNIQPDSFGNLEIAINQKLYNKEKGEVIGGGSAIGIDLSKFEIDKRDTYNSEIRKKYEINMTSFVFGYVGRMVRDKGINELLLAFKKMTMKNTNISLLMVGSLKSIKGIDKKLLSWAKESPSVIFTDFVIDVQKYYSAMNCFILPSYHEGFGSSIIEAEAMGTAVITTDIPGPREAILPDISGFIINKKDSTSLLNAMNELIETLELAERFGRAGRQYVENKYDQKTLLKEIYENRVRIFNDSLGLTR